MTEALIPNLTALTAPLRGGASAATRPGAGDSAAAESFSAQFERSQAGSLEADAGVASRSASDLERARDDPATDSAHDALNEFLSQWLPGANPATLPPAQARVAAADQAVADAEPAGLPWTSATAAPGEAGVAAAPRSGSTPTQAGVDGAISAAPRVGPPGLQAVAHDARIDTDMPRPGPEGAAAERPALRPPGTDRGDRSGRAERNRNIEGSDRSDAAAGRPARGGPLDADTLATEQPPANSPVVAASSSTIDPAATLAPAPAAAPLSAETPAPPADAPALALSALPVGTPAPGAGAAPHRAPATEAVKADSDRAHPAAPGRVGLEPLRRSDLADARPSPSAQDPLPSGRPAATPGKASTPIGSESPAFGDAAAQRPGFGTAANELPMPARPADAEAAAVPAQNAAPLHHLPAVAGAAPPGGAPVPVSEYSIAAPVQSPQFAEALGVQVSVLARGGIERAELQLNPASMGPLSVQITLDAGQAQAQVYFGSDSAQTRQAVEAGMPALAAALRDAGFTLSGGGVSQHPGDPRQHGSGARGTTNFGLRPPAAPDEELRPLRSVRAAPGRLDLYA